MSNPSAGSAEPESFLPLTPAMFHILMALAKGESHGYTIMQDIETSTDGAYRIGPGTLYGSIKRMPASGRIEEVDERPDPDLDDERLAEVYQMSTTALFTRISGLVSAAGGVLLLILVYGEFVWGGGWRNAGFLDISLRFMRGYRRGRLLCTGPVR